jgi:hypothetical protein
VLLVAVNTATVCAAISQKTGCKCKLIYADSISDKSCLNLFVTGFLRFFAIRG